MMHRKIQNVLYVLTGGTEEAYARAWGGMLILLILIMVLFGLARYLSGRKAS